MMETKKPSPRRTPSQKRVVRRKGSASIIRRRGR